MQSNLLMKCNAVYWTWGVFLDKTLHFKVSVFRML